MASLNKVMIIGNLGRDPEVSYTPGGMAVAKLSVATTDVWVDRASGERKERTEWHRVTAFGKLGETCGRYLSKGRQVYVEGKLQTSSYEKDGITRYSTDIIASTLQFLGGRQGDAPGFQNNTPQGGYQNSNQGYGGGSFGGAPQNGGFQGGGYQDNTPQGGYPPDNSPQGGFQPDQGGFQSPPDDDIPF